MLCRGELARDRSLGSAPLLVMHLSCGKVASSVENFNMSRPTSQLHIGLMFQRTLFMSHI
eukprot:scaffold9605_cov128-Skeletonema_marinoi.AAC.1